MESWKVQLTSLETHSQSFEYPPYLSLTLSTGRQ